jgi:N-methylhydantoinase A
MEQVNLKNGITVDMGGTSYDVCVLADRGVPMTHERRVMEMPVKVPSVDILTIGAGGGSLGWLDAAGQFAVGPRSAGAVPGPACYGRGGEEPTVTDANLVLGVLGDGQMLGGEVTLDAGAAHRACERLGKRLGIGALEAAWGIRRIVNANMAGATRAVSVGRGHDPRDFTLIAFGGAGPMHAVDIAADLDIPEVLVPSVPGCYSALGLVVSDVTHDYVATYLATISGDLEPRLDVLLAELKTSAHAELEAEGIEVHRRDLFPALELRYVGEQSSITVPANGSRNGWLLRTRDEFHQEHERLYGFSALEEPVEVVNVRLRAVGRLHRGSAAKAPQAAGQPAKPRASGTRKVTFGTGKDDRLEVPVFERATLRPGTSFVGPAIVQQEDTTLLVPPKRLVRSDDYGNLRIRTDRQ